ncbi:hypothetical protein VP01_1539g1 [Puccinia sorghi]|uniref:Uncharacterized protein n=1 Tax=Puccinia sorghi TaxID=27349 RepID=A0A0L6VIK0_9BASI|nr:hypothetical protein VP01_1539g1 [Puccinia sorghi]
MILAFCFWSGSRKWQLFPHCLLLISICSQLVNGRDHLLREMWTQLINHKYMKVTIKWIIRIIVLQNHLVHLKDQWNELYEDEPDFAPVAGLSWGKLQEGEKRQCFKDFQGP